MMNTLELLTSPAPATTTWTWQGWGTSLCWFANVIGHDSQLTERLSRLLFDAREGLGLNIVRYNIGGSDVQAASQFRPGAAAPCFRQSMTDTTMHWQIDQPQLNVLKAAMSMGATTVQAFVNSPPFFWTKSGSSKGATGRFQTNLKQQHDDDFAEFVAQVVTYFKDELGIDFYSISPFNEPSSLAWVHPASTQEGCRFSYGRALQVLKAMSKHPCLCGKLSVFEEFCIADSVLRLALAPRHAFTKAVKHICTHTYNSTAFVSAAWAKFVAKLQDNRVARWLLKHASRGYVQKPLWVSEYGQGSSDNNNNNNDFAAKIMYDIVSLQASAWIYWQAVEDIDSDWGLLSVPFRELVGASTVVKVNPKYQILKVFAQHLRPNSQVYVLTPNAIGAFNRINNTVSIILTHDGTNGLVQVKLPSTAKAAHVQVHNYNPMSNVTHAYTLDPDAMLAHDKSLCVAIPLPGGVTGITFSLAAASMRMTLP